MSLFNGDFEVWSGGQTGVDRGALEAATAFNLPYGGFVPKNGRAEDGLNVLQRFPYLKELATDSYSTRTKKNIDATEKTLILGGDKPAGPGTRLTFNHAKAKEKPLLAVRLSNPQVLEKVVEFVEPLWLAGGKLNVAGPRESGAVGCQAATKAILLEVFAVLKAKHGDAYAQERTHGAP